MSWLTKGLTFFLQVNWILGKVILHIFNNFIIYIIFNEKKKEKIIIINHLYFILHTLHF